MYLIKESESRLNQQAILLKSKDVSFRVHFWGIDPCLTYNPIHRHSFFEICYVLAGEGTYLDEGIVYSLHKGTFFCSRPRISHQIQSKEGLFLLWVSFELDETTSSSPYIDQYLSMAQEGIPVVYNGNTASTASLWKSLLIPDQKQWAIPSSALSSIAHTLLLSFVSLFLKTKEQIQTNHPVSNPILQRAKLFITDNIEKELTLEIVAHYLNVSTRHLSRLFSEGINESFVTFIKKERVKKASYLLEKTELPIKEIASKTGFGSVHYFTRIFRQEVGLPPGQFRQNIRD
ncbi:helix-turn-helix domain-containing protein [Halalkalibacter kiskunsagensis]|uniref:Helix-turn-helix domain-containing protein n=1 Tax=Halalkalibacter kiskunsagensis TaxID=1548599 RepID=A0ABV6KJE0_9BACI